VLVFDDATGSQVDAPPGSEHAALLALLPGPPPAAPGRPRLGVVARKVTLLPRHWEWLAEQPGGASAALRRLVERARIMGEPAGGRRQAVERCYRATMALAGDQGGFEEAARALFAGDRPRFEVLIAAWPTDVIAYALELAAPGWPADKSHGKELPT